MKKLILGLVNLYNWMPTMDEMKEAIKKVGFKILESEQIDTLSFGMILTQSDNQLVFIKACK